ncbi:MAG: SPASM domain-containing protein [Planctomycetota bacterium]
MTKSPSVIALIVADASAGRLGHARRLDTPLAGRPALWHTLQRAGRIARVGRIVVVHPPGQDPLAGIDTSYIPTPIETFAHGDVAGDNLTPRLRSARKWALSGWRGGLAGATAWDELLPARPLALAMDQFKAEAAVLVGGDWCGFDPGYADGLLDIHLDAPEAMKVTFTQAPPGLSPLVTSRAVLHDLADKQATFGGVLAYNPKRPAIDPISRECNLPIAADVRDTARRFIFDTPGSIQRLERIAETLDEDFLGADAAVITDACRGWEIEHPGHITDELPEQITIELTPIRLVNGPITPQHYVDLPRSEMDFDLACGVIAQCGGKAVTLGGLGDALLHPRWPELVKAAANAGVFGLHIETDLLSPREELAPLTELPIDIVSVRLNADTAATYAKVMGEDRLPEVMANLQWLFDRRRTVTESQNQLPGLLPGVGAGLPWIIPRLVKTADTLKDMEMFFERWMQVVGHAVIERPMTLGKGSFALVPDLSPVPMDPPWKPPSPHQVKRRLTVLSDGTVTLCGQDALGRASLGNAADNSLRDLWRRVADLEIPGSSDDSPVCRRCYDWWSLRRQEISSGVAKSPICA